jgi:signal transduction histidine kinase
MLQTIKGKFILSALLIIILSIGGPAVFFFYQVDENFEERSQIMLSTSLNAIEASIRHAMTHDKKNIYNVLARHVLNQNIDKIRIFNLNGEITFSSDSTEVGKNIKQIVLHHQDIDYKEGIILNKLDSVYSALVPLENTTECQKCHEENGTIGYLDIDAKLTHPELQFYTGIKHSMFLAVLVIILLTLTLYFIFRHFIEIPLKGFIEALDEVQAGNLKIRRTIKNDDEFGVLDQHFNHMVNKLEKSNEEIKTFHFEQLQRADKLVTLGELAAEMAHEINNPAGVIMMRTDYLQLEAEDVAGLEKYREDIDVILQQTQKIAKITNHILKYSKKLPRNFGNIELLNVIEESLNILEPRIKKRNILLKKTFLVRDQVNTLLIYADAQQLEQVFTNLFNNAIDALEGGGVLEVRVACIKEEKVQVLIRDDGNGMDEVAKEQAFLPFFTTKSAKKGTGLGLYIVKNILKNHKANINCSSTLGKGTTFTLLFNKSKEK